MSSGDGYEIVVPESVEAELERLAPGTWGQVEVAVNNAMNNLLGYPHRFDHVWSDWLSVSRSELEEIFRRWRAARET